MMIDLDQLKADREAGTDGPWEVQKSPFEVINRDHGFLPNHIIAGDDIMLAALYPENIEDPDARRIARLPELEAAYIEVVAKLDMAVEALKTEREDTIKECASIAIKLGQCGNVRGHADCCERTAEDIEQSILALITAKSERDE